MLAGGDLPACSEESPSKIKVIKIDPVSLVVVVAVGHSPQFLDVEGICGFSSSRQSQHTQTKTNLAGLIPGDVTYRGSVLEAQESRSHWSHSESDPRVDRVCWSVESSGHHHHHHQQHQELQDTPPETSPDRQNLVLVRISKLIY